MQIIKNGARSMVVLLALLAVGACGEDQPPEKSEVRAVPAPMGKIWVRGAGATFPQMLYETWTEAYQASYPEIWVTYSPVGSGAGVSKFIAGSVDFGATDGALTDAQVAQMERGVHRVPATAGLIVLAYNIEGLQGELKLTRELYADIFAGRIRNWNDPRIKTVNPDLMLPNRTIALVARRDGSGTTYAFTNHVSTISAMFRTEGPGVGYLVSWPAGTMLAQGNQGVAQRIKISDGAIGYVGYEFAKRLGLSMAILENKAGRFIKPDAERGAQTLAATVGQMPDDLQLFMPDPDGEASYPIITYSWLLLYDHYDSERKRTAVTNFVRWGLTEGQAFSRDLGYVPLPAEVVTRGVAAVDNIR